MVQLIMNRIVWLSKDLRKAIPSGGVSTSRNIRKVKLIQRMPRLGVLELPPILQKRLVAHHDHMALGLEKPLSLPIIEINQSYRIVLS